MEKNYKKKCSGKPVSSQQGAYSKSEHFLKRMPNDCSLDPMSTMNQWCTLNLALGFAAWLSQEP